MKTKTKLSGALFIALVIGFTIAIPLLLIWSLNTLNVANASYGLFEWFAAAVLTAVFLGGTGE